MALGGGMFTVQNKILPGAYINFMSAARASTSLSDRGIVAMPFVADWGKEKEVIEISNEDFIKHSLKQFGYDYTHPKMQMFREIFKHAKQFYGYRLNSDAEKAKNELATALYGGSRGNAIKIIIENDIDTEHGFIVKTMLENVEVDRQAVLSAEELKDNDFVTFQKGELQETAGMPLTGGTDGQGKTAENYQTFLNKIEKYSFHALGCNTDQKEIIDLFIAFTKRMRDECGVKFQTVVYRAENADHEGVLSLENKIFVDKNGLDEFSLVYWLTGAVAGCVLQKSLTNVIYDGEYEIDTDYTQRQLTQAIEAGKFLFHKVGDKVCILKDINTFVSFTKDKSQYFQSNQIIRVLDQIGNDIAGIFNTKYLGKVQNNYAGRVAFWNDIVDFYKNLERIEAITDFVSEDIVVEQGESKESVVVTTYVTPVQSMEKLYMTVIVR